MCCWESHTSPPAGTPPPADTYYRSTDGGASWQHVSGIDGSLIYQFATSGATIYALRVATPAISARRCNCRPAAMAWRRGMPLMARFGAEPRASTSSGSTRITARCSPQCRHRSGIIRRAIWRSGDGGATLALPASATNGMTTVLVQPPQPNHPVGHLCRGLHWPGNLLYCGDDSGQGWHDMPALDVGDTAGAVLVHYAAYTSDGAILALKRRRPAAAR